MSPIDVLREDRQIKSADIRLELFTVADLKAILQLLREIERRDPGKLVFLRLDVPELSIEEAKNLVAELWPR